MDAIDSRRSVRSYAPAKLGHNTIKELLAAAIRAPTAIHEEPWAFVIVQDVALLKRLSDRAKEFFAQEQHTAKLHHGSRALDAFTQPEFNVFYNASTLILICADVAGPFVAADCWLAAENLMLAACSLGLGTCVIGSAVSAFNDPQVKAELGIPEGATAVAPIIVGEPYGITPQTSRKEPRIFVWK
jgi:nitroreductase